MKFLKKSLVVAFLVSALSHPLLHAEYTRDNLCGYIRMQTPQKSLPRITDFLKDMVDDPYFDAETSVFLSMFGHPNYDGLSQEENVAMFFFKEKNEPTDIILMAQFQKNSKLKNSIMSRG